jgi:hypothetical protein
MLKKEKLLPVVGSKINKNIFNKLFDLNIIKLSVNKDFWELTDKGIVAAQNISIKTRVKITDIPNGTDCNGEDIIYEECMKSCCQNLITISDGSKNFIKNK